MKTHNLKKIFLSGVFVISAMTLMIGCNLGGGGGGSKRATTNPNNVNRPCTGCSAQTDLLVSALGNSEAPASVQLALDFYATAQTSQPQDDPYNPYNQGYSGPVEANGWLFVENGAFSGGYGCPSIPRGVYQLRMISGGQGQMEYGMVEGVRMEAISGGNRINVRVNAQHFALATPQMVSCRGEEYSSEFMGYLQIDSVNSISCGGSGAIYFSDNRENACE